MRTSDLAAFPSEDFVAFPSEDFVAFPSEDFVGFPSEDFVGLNTSLLLSASRNCSRVLDGRDLVVVLESSSSEETLELDTDLEVKLLLDEERERELRLLAFFFLASFSYTFLLTSLCGRFEVFDIDFMCGFEVFEGEIAESLLFLLSSNLCVADGGSLSFRGTELEVLLMRFSLSSRELGA